MHETLRFGYELLRRFFEHAHSESTDRNKIPPIFVFAKTGEWRDVRFIGLAVPGGADIENYDDLVAVWRTSKGLRFQNYRARFTILDVPRISRAWLDSPLQRVPSPIAVADTGAGMTSDIIEKAFDPFFTTKSIGKGTGLGLSQVYGFVRQSGGHVKIYSELGMGTSVKIYLPRHYDETEATEQVRQVLNVRRGLHSEVVLVVEDDERVRALSVEALKELGYTVIEVLGQSQALRMLDERAACDLAVHRRGHARHVRKRTG